MAWNLWDRKKGLKKIDINKIKNVDIFIHHLNIVINNKKQLLKTLVIVKLNRIISDIKTKSKIDNVYNFNDKDKLFMIYNDLDKYIKHLKKGLGEYKTRFKNYINRSGWITYNSDETFKVKKYLNNNHNTLDKY